MGEAKPFKPARLVMGVLYSDEAVKQKLFGVLEAQFGTILHTSDSIPFTHTDYYTQEMGSPIIRFFVAFTELVDPANLAAIKTKTNRMEIELSGGEHRRVNLDPGILTQDSLMLATTKNRSHRIPLQDGIYGEVTLLYAHGAFQILPWTYPDYQSETTRELFKQWRAEYLKQMKQ